MARPRRNFTPGEVYHVVNRGNDKRAIFETDSDYEHFLWLMKTTRRDLDIDIVGYSLLTTHFHLMLSPGNATAIPDFMHRVAGQYAVSFRTKRNTLGLGHVFQDRYFGAGVEDELGFLTVLGYVEMNAREAGRVSRAEDWPWCSLADRASPRPGLMTHCRVSLPAHWVEMVNLPWREFLDALVRHDLEKRRRRRSEDAT
jgi:putative transposase